MLEEQRTEQDRDQLDRIASAVEQLPGRVARAMRNEGVGRPRPPRMRSMLIEAEREHQEAREAKRRANLAIALTGVTAFGSLLAAIATLIHG